MAEYPHVKLIEESEVKLKDLPSDLQSEIKVFNLHKGKKSEPENKIASLAIAQKIYAILEAQGDGGAGDNSGSDGAGDKAQAPAAADGAGDKPQTAAAGDGVGDNTPPAATDDASDKSQAAPAAGDNNTPPTKKKRFIPMLGWIDVK
jgi:hypothetical protein